MAASLTLILAFLLVLAQMAVLLAGAGALLKRLGLRSTLLRAAAAFVIISLAAYAAVFVYLANPRLGVAWSILVLVAAAAQVVLHGYVAGWSLAELRYIDWRRPIMTEVGRIGVLVIAAAALVLGLGCLFGGAATPLEIARLRFSHALPVDNALPEMLANALHAGGRLSPLFGDWLASDRPPLQAGFVLLARPFLLTPPGMQYEALSVLLQVSCLGGLYFWLRRADVGSPAIALVLLAVCGYGFFWLNAFFVWPKLIAVTYLAIVAALVLVDDGAEASGMDEEDGRPCLWIAALAGAAAALAMLSHGGSIFALLALTLAMLLIRGWPGWRFAMVALVTALAVHLPWTLFQAMIDPPGNRLLHLHLAGIEPVDPRSTWAVIRDAYAGRSLSQLVAMKLANFDVMVGHWRTLLRHLADVAAAPWTLFRERLGDLRVIPFFHLVPALGPFVFGPLALAIATARRGVSPVELRAVAAMWSVATLTVLIWGLLLYRDPVIHQGSYFSVLGLVAAGVLSFWLVSRFAAFVVVALHVVYNAAVFGPLGPEAIKAGMAAKMDPAMAALASIAIAGIGWTLWRVAVSERPDSAVAAASTAGPIGRATYRPGYPGTRRREHPPP